MKPSVLSNVLVAGQFSTMGGIAILGSRGILMSPHLLALAFAAFALGVHALLAIGLRTFQIHPEPKDTATLCRNGIYKWIRHPMYLAVLLFCLALVASSEKLALSAILFLVLLVIFVMKMSLEEDLWTKRDPEQFYPYLKATKRLIPFVY